MSIVLTALSMGSRATARLSKSRGVAMAPCSEAILMVWRCHRGQERRTSSIVRFTSSVNITEAGGLNSSDFDLDSTEMKDYNPLFSLTFV